MKEETPQWEIDFNKQFLDATGFLDNGYYHAPNEKLGEEIKTFIKSTLEEVIDKIPTEITSTSPDGDEIGIYSADLKAQLRKEFL